MVAEKYKLKQYNCYACDVRISQLSIVLYANFSFLLKNAENTAFFTLDGNFQLKRRRIVNNNLAILGVPKSVDRLWGSKADVEAFSAEGNDQNKNDVKIAICLTNNERLTNNIIRTISVSWKILTAILKLQERAIAQ